MYINSREPLQRHLHIRLFLSKKQRCALRNPSRDVCIVCLGFSIYYFAWAVAETCSHHTLSFCASWSEIVLLLLWQHWQWNATVTATHCSTLQHDAAHARALQYITASRHTTPHCTILHQTLTHCSTLPEHCSTSQHRDTLHLTATHYSTLQQTATHCSTLPEHCSTSQHCDTLKHDAIQYNKQQHTAAHCQNTAAHHSIATH